MIKIRLNPVVFNAGGVFYGVSQSRAVLSVDTNKPAGYAGFLNTREQPSQSQSLLLIDADGTELSNFMLEHHMVSSGNSRNTFGQIILDFVERGLILVEQDGTPLTAVQLNSYTAP